MALHSRRVSLPTRWRDLKWKTYRRARVTTRRIFLPHPVAGPEQFLQQYAQALPTRWHAAPHFPCDAELAQTLSTLMGYAAGDTPLSQAQSQHAWHGVLLRLAGKAGSPAVSLAAIGSDSTHSDPVTSGSACPLAGDGCRPTSGDQ